MAVRFWTGENLSVPYTGKATQITVDIFDWVTEDDLFWAEGELPPPFVLTHPVQVEGTDFPIFTRQRIDDPEDWLFEEQHFPTYLPAINDGDWPLPVSLLPPDETPLQFSWRQSSNQEEALAQEQALLDGQPLEDLSDWFLPFELGGTVYGDNLCRLMNEIQRHLLEHGIDEGQTWSLWTREEVLQMIRTRIEYFLHETSLTRRRNTIEVAAETSEVEVPEDLIQMRRVIWQDVQGRQILPRIDPWSLDNSDQLWEDGLSRPLYYTEQPMPNRIIKLIPSPSVNGILELNYVAKPAEFDDCDALPLPMMWIPYIKYGVLADMLSKEGEANDPERAHHFRLRWDEGVELARSFLGVEY